MTPEIDETKYAKAFSVAVELPGMDEKDVDINLSGRQLSIRGEKEQEAEQEDKDYYRRERMYVRHVPAYFEISGRDRRIND